MFMVRSRGKGRSQDARWVARYNGIIRDVLRYDAARPHGGSLSDDHATQDRGSGANGGSPFYGCGDAGPISLCLSRAIAIRGTREAVIDEGHAMTDENLVFEGDSLAKKAVAGNFTTVAHANTSLDLHKGADLHVVPDLAAIQVGESEYLYSLAQFDVGRDALKVLGAAHAATRPRGAAITLAPS